MVWVPLHQVQMPKTSVNPMAQRFPIGTKLYVPGFQWLKQAWFRWFKVKWFSMYAAYLRTALPEESLIKSYDFTSYINIYMYTCMILHHLNWIADGSLSWEPPPLSQHAKGPHQQRWRVVQAQRSQGPVGVGSATAGGSGSSTVLLGRMTPYVSSKRQ